MEKKLYLLTDEKNPEKIRTAVLKPFGISDASTFQFTVESDNFGIDMVILSEGMGEEEKESAKKQINGIAGHFYHTKTVHSDIRTNLVTYLLWMNSIVMMRCETEQSDSADISDIIKKLLSSSDEINSLLLVAGDDDEPGKIYRPGSNGEAECILSDDGESDLETYLPPRKPSPFTDAPTEQRARRERTMKVLDEKCLMLPTMYPFVETEESSNCRSLDEVLHRTIALLAISLYAEVLMDEESDIEDAHDLVSNVMNMYGMTEDWFSPNELEFFNDEDPSDDDATNYTWQYENLYVCEWALGLTELDFPDHYCDVSGIVKRIHEYKSYDELKNACSLRTPGELLDADDLVFCLDWSCVDNRIHRLPSVAGMDQGVVFERHKTLDWLVGADESADWDDVQPNT